MVKMQFSVLQKSNFHPTIRVMTQQHRPNSRDRKLCRMSLGAPKCSFSFSPCRRNLQADVTHKCAEIVCRLRRPTEKSASPQIFSLSDQIRLQDEQLLWHFFQRKTRPARDVSTSQKLLVGVVLNLDLNQSESPIWALSRSSSRH